MIDIHVPVKSIENFFKLIATSTEVEIFFLHCTVKLSYNEVLGTNEITSLYL